jgi:hypothetical protein
MKSFFVFLLVISATPQVFGQSTFVPARVIVPRSDLGAPGGDGSTAGPINSEPERTDEDSQAFVLKDPARVSLGFHYLHSRWSELSRRIDDGSLGFQVLFSREFVRNIESGLGFSSFSGVSGSPGTVDSQANENIYGAHLDAQTKFFLTGQRIRPFVGAALHWGFFRAWSVQSETDSTISFRKHGSGYLFGGSPFIGVESQLTDRLGAEWIFGYRAFVDKPQLYTGGWFMGLNLRFTGR